MLRKSNDVVLLKYKKTNKIHRKIVNLPIFTNKHELFTDPKDNKLFSVQILDAWFIYNFFSQNKFLYFWINETFMLLTEMYNFLW